jgi:hypothetical protein
MAHEQMSETRRSIGLAFRSFESKSWVIEWQSGPRKDEAVELLGTNQLPLPLTLSACLEQAWGHIAETLRPWTMYSAGNGMIGLEVR